MDTASSYTGHLLSLAPEQLQELLSKMGPAQRSQLLQQIPPDQLRNKLNTFSPGQKRLMLNQFPLLQGVMTPSKGSDTASVPPPPLDRSVSEILANDVLRESISKTFNAKLNLKQFGYDLFTAGGALESDPNISVPMDYVIGPGDTFRVHLAGKVFQEHRLEVNREGMIFSPGIGFLPVAGLRFQEFKEMLRAKVKEQLIGMELTHVTIGALRTIRVLVLGDVVKPGTYRVSALSSMTQTLLASGGIKPIGSLRNIQLKRRGKVVNTLDLYQLLLHGDDSKDVRVQGGDVIFIPPIGDTIGVSGEVKRPAIYEIPHDITLKESLDMAGGLLPVANPKKVKLERIDKRQRRLFYDLDITRPKMLNTRVQSGDTIQVLAVRGRPEGIIHLKGHLDHPGTYQWRPGLRLTDVLPPKSKLKPETDLSYTLISRVNPKDGRLSTHAVRLDRALADPSSSDNMRLKPKDTVVIFSRGRSELNNRENDLTGIVRKIHDQTRFSHQEQLVTVEGHVRFPGIYPYSIGMGVRELIHAAGDLQPNADLNYALVVRNLANGEVEPFSIRLGEVLDRTAGRGNFSLKPSDFLLVFKFDDMPKNLFRSFDLDQLRGRLEGQDEAALELRGKAGKEKRGDVVLKKSQTFREDFFYPGGQAQGGMGHLENRMVGNKETDSTVLVLKSTNRVVQTLPKETLSRKKLLEPVLAKLREQATRERPARIVLVSGEVRHPTFYPLERGMRVSDLIRAGGMLKESAFTLKAILTRFEVKSNRYRQISHQSVDLRKILQGDPVADIELKPHDVLQVNRIPRWTEVSRVSLSGEVRFPGIYTLRDGETLMDLLNRAGGVTQLAFPEGAVFLRQSLKERERKEMNALLKKLEMQLAQEQSKPESTRANEANRVNTGLLVGLIDQLRHNDPQGRLAINLPEIMDKATRNIPYTHITLRDGDQLIIPKQSNEVTVLGEVYYPTSHQFKARLGLQDYINLSGGYAQKADQDRVYVVKANGQVVPTQQTASSFGSSWFTGSTKIGVNPGDTIVVPMEVDKVMPMVLWKDIAQILSNISITAATLNTIGAL